MKIWKLVLSLVLALPLFSWEDLQDHQAIENRGIHFVSLGSHCEPAVMLKELDLRQTAFPLDWLVTINHIGLLTLIDNDFEDLLHRDHLFISPMGGVEENRYKIEFKHDGDLLSDPAVLAAAQEKYQRRIERFRQIGDYAKKVFFIRTAYDPPYCGPTYWLEEPFIDSFQADTLKKALDRYFPTLNFTLVIINYKEDFPYPIDEIEGVVEYKISKSNRKEDYKTIFHTLLSENL